MSILALGTFLRDTGLAVVLIPKSGVKLQGYPQRMRLYDSINSVSRYSWFPDTVILVFYFIKSSYIFILKLCVKQNQNSVFRSLNVESFRSLIKHVYIP